MFRRGDRVRALLDYDGKRLSGLSGTVVDVQHECVSVEFDRRINGHNCHGTAREGHGYNIWSAYPERWLGLLDSNPEEEPVRDYIDEELGRV